MNKINKLIESSKKIKKTQTMIKIEKAMEKLNNYLPKDKKEMQSKEEIYSVLIYFLNLHLELKGQQFPAKEFITFKELIEDIDKLI